MRVKGMVSHSPNFAAIAGGAKLRGIWRASENPNAESGEGLKGMEVATSCALLHRTLRYVLQNKRRLDTVGTMVAKHV